MTIELRINQIIHTCLPLLDEGSRKGVIHYASVDEFEMAFEGLIIEFMAAFTCPPSGACYCYEEWSLLIKELELETEATFDCDLTENFELWTKGLPQRWSNGVEEGVAKICKAGKPRERF